MEELIGDLNRLVAKQCISCALIPAYGVAMICFTGETTLYISVENGTIKLEVDAPCLQ
jgi:hypothetical protein